jgi:cytochrome P450
MVAISLDVTIAAVLGIRDPARAALFRRHLRALFETMGPFVLFLQALRVDLGLLSPWGRFIGARRRFRGLIAEEIRARRAHPDGSRDDILNVLLSARDEDGLPMPDDELQDHLLTFLVLGHESTASALTWGIDCIYRDRRVLSALQEELAGLPASAGSEDIARLPYLGAVCKEILRARPIVPEPRRRVLKEPWRVRGYTIPAGTYLAPSVYLIHHHPALYPDAAAFRPERFLERRFASHEYMPFGGGSRRCTGAAFAEYEMALVLATILASAELRVEREASIVPRRMNLAVGPSTGVEVTVRAHRRA